MEGNWDQEDYKYLTIDILICNNQTYNNKCGTDEEIAALLNGGFISIDIFNSGTNLRLKGNPYTPIGFDSFTSISKAFHKNVFMYFRYD